MRKQTRVAGPQSAGDDVSNADADSQCSVPRRDAGLEQPNCYEARGLCAEQCGIHERENARANGAAFSK